MAHFIETLEKIVQHTAEIGIVIAEIIGISILIITALKCFIKYFRSVCSGEYHYTLCTVKTVHFRQKLVKGLFSFVISSAVTRIP